MDDQNKISEFVACQTRADLANVLDMPLRTLTYYAYGAGKSYRRFTIPKKSGGEREIFAPNYKLKQIQRKLAILLQGVYLIPKGSHGFALEKSIVTNAEPHLRRKLLLNFDLKDFFGSITQARVYRILTIYPGFPREVAHTISSLCCFQEHLPQGAPTSPVLSNIACFRLDTDFMSLANAESIRYTRYADDITLSSMSATFPESILFFDAGKQSYVIGQAVEQIVQRYRLSINHDKTRFSSGKQSKYVTGIKVNSKQNLDRRYVRNIRAMLHDWAVSGPKKAAKRHDTIHGYRRDFKEVVRGKINFIKDVKGATDPVYTKLYNTFVELEGRGRRTFLHGQHVGVESKLLIVDDTLSGKTGTGFILNDQWLVTCAHTVSKLNEGDTVNYFNCRDFGLATVRRARLVFRDSVNDFAVFGPTSSDGVFGYDSFLPAQEHEVRNITYGTACHVWGFPNYHPSRHPFFATSMVSSKLHEANGRKLYILNQNVFSGMSGGPVLNLRGEVLGMLVLGTDHYGSANVTFENAFLPISAVLSGISSIPREPTIEF